MLNVYIVRHGQTDTNKTLAINGSGTNLPLNETGIKQAEALRDSFDINKIDYVYASPLTRAKQTAEILNQNKHNIIYDDRLKEMNYGNWDGKSAADIRSKYPQAFDDLGYFTENYTNYCTGESYEHLAARLTDFWHDLVQRHVNESVALVFHGTASRSMVKNILGSKKISKIGEMQNAGVTNISVDDHSKEAFLRYYNRVAPCNFFIE
ncbi:histidine phosphatase family protein [Lactobacillus panisapium]|uniref:histidine phosphatase family protein n=1 Tax=Lactobacillus panisapium TaxID=2012495 RepID=UPI001C69B7CE|nr:histidine phosphatase family protein [Lactobacillus panisapium]QYN55143.1 histidine phosphatase family protein [Lactobacillus panisapium]